ncbi:hypothetical protein NKR17_08570 [Priestia flexa]|uniref:hypothetical protein n=1 Tax=Priestia flexa TaxID=86664 RepID=UPI00203F2F59|nr:hypothetical protein [Priestia flexa]MCM3067866.1 hypothetical protein [Priestia flexa]MCP1189126.1 hypothetical protein [Priestia flexa]
MNKYFIILLFISLITPTQASAKAKNHPLTYYGAVQKGKIIPWKEAQHLLLKGKKFTVIDMDTGLSFNVQRRAGNKHADVQPLTRTDTAVMKYIYDNHWSWNRKAVLIPVKGQLIAASMNGMPHGAGALDNGFPGHFCIHFLGSTTHKRNHADPDHQMMVLKAGDNLEKFVSTATPEQLIQLFLIGVKQQDETLLKAAVGEKQLQQIYSKVKKIEALNYKKEEIEEKIENSPLVVKGKVKILTIAVEKGKGQTSLSMEFDLERSAVNDLWEIKQVNFK